MPLAGPKSSAPARPPARIPQLRGQTAADLIYAALRSDIIAMRIAPGQPVNEKQLALAHGVSRTPVREALLRLAGDQLVQIFPQSGTFVARIPVAALPEAILVRTALEDLTVRRATGRIDAEQIATLRTLVDQQRKLEKSRDHDGFHAADDAFHSLIAEIANHPGIWQLVEQVKVQVDRFRRLTLPVPGRMGRVVVEHASVVDAIASGDVDAASAAMTKHLEGLSSSIRDVRDFNAEFFDIPADWPKP